jgi:hypothetical protein
MELFKAVLIKAISHNTPCVEAFLVLLIGF